MELVNQTPAVAHAFVSSLPGFDKRIGMVSAKLTFRIDERGATTIDTQTPVPYLKEDVDTPLGPIPKDDVLRRSPLVEVGILGTAVAPNRQPAEAVAVKASIGGHERVMYVYGDRRWIGTGSRATISRPDRFVEMPLTWDRAFGGSVDVYMDAKNSIPAGDPWNPLGRGFNWEHLPFQFRHAFGAAPGFPLVRPEERLLPNLENPQQPVTKWEDQPEPWCWSPIPMQVPYRCKDMTERHRAGAEAALEDPAAVDPLAALAPGREVEWDEYLFRAHRTWIVSIPAGPIDISLAGFATPRERFGFRIPDVRVFADYAAAGRTGSLPLAMQNLVLQADERWCTVSYRSSFVVDAPSEVERSFRLRVENQS